MKFSQVFFVLLIVTLSAKVNLGQDCTLGDIQNTPGKCVPFSKCYFAIDNFKAGVRPKICNGKVVCCPTEETIAKKKCSEWKSHLSTPINSFFGSPTGEDEPFCTDLEPQGFIKGGRNARKYEYPHAVALGDGKSEETYKYFCGGTLISEDFVLTAAHCVLNTRRPTIVLIGDLTLERNTSSFRKIIKIAEIITHPNYKPPLAYNDIALIKLREKLEISRYLLPACLPIPGQRHGKKVEAVGWGTLGFGEPQANHLQAVNLTTYTQKECNAFYEDQSDKQLRYPKGIQNTQICAGDSGNEGKDTCNGDSGGPLTVNEIYRDTELRCLFRIIGITSFGPRLCGYSTPAIYTKVQSFVNWIESIAFTSS